MLGSFNRMFLVLLVSFVGLRTSPRLLTSELDGRSLSFSSHKIEMHFEITEFELALIAVAWILSETGLLHFFLQLTWYFICLFTGPLPRPRS